MSDITYVYLTPSFSFVTPKDMFSIDGGRVYAWSCLYQLCIVTVLEHGPDIFWHSSRSKVYTPALEYGLCEC